MNELADAHSFFRIGDRLVAQIFNVNIAGDSVVQTQFDTGRLTGTGTCIKVVPHVRQFGKVVFQTERTLPQSRFVVTDRICGVQLFT